MRAPIWYVDYYVIPRLPRSHLKAWLEGMAFNHAHRDDPVYRGLTVHYRVGRFVVRYNGHRVRYRSGPKNELGLGEISGYLLRHGLAPGDVVVDAGAFEGVFTILAARLVGPRGKVIAFEPDSQNRRKLEENVRLNKLKNVIVVGKGLWSSDGTAQFCESGDDFSCLSESVLETNVSAGWNPNTTIEVASLDKELGRLGVDHVDFLKADVEGAEIEMLKGAGDVLSNSRTKVSIASYHVVEGEMTCYRVEELLRSYGYEAETNFPLHPTTYGRKA